VAERLGKLYGDRAVFQRTTVAKDDAAHFGKSGRRNFNAIRSQSANRNIEEKASRDR
jgi:hypothetical protein